MDTGISSASIATGAGLPDQDSTTVSAGYGVNLSQDAADFAQSLERVKQASEVQEPSEVSKAIFAPLDFINNEAREIAAYAQSAIESGNELTPGEIVTLTTRSHEFMFYSQLTSNVANRTADGLQQLFRQQS